MLKGKTAVITGSNRGIGMATVRLFAENHARIWACSRTQNEEFLEFCRSLSDEYGTEATPVYFDVTDENAVKDAVKKIGRNSQSLDVLVNNAGVSTERLFSMTPVESIRESLEVNFLSQVRLSQLVSRYMIRQKSGSIINIASVAGIEREQGGLAYGSSKASVIFSTKTMALELGMYGIRVNCVSPGFINTDMWIKRSDDLRNKILGETPLRRQGEPEEVAGAILFLASRFSSFITGQNIVVDGGRMGGVYKMKTFLIDSIGV